MQTVAEIISDANAALSIYNYYQRLNILNHGTHHLKLRLYVRDSLFVQINRNELASLTNLVLIFKGRRIYGRDEFQGVWHRHPESNPDYHDTSIDGSRPVTLLGFLKQ
ncbi:hypothetical protein H8E77_24785 [bacterium]|nr:hypothetical protein [bacterium]